MLRESITHVQYIYTLKKQASVARIIFAGFFGSFSISINKILLDAQISEYNKQLSTTPNAYDTSQDNTNPTPMATPQIYYLHSNHRYL